jgi:raffinose/stachyose/melibiose transport system substrate-binding protein
MLAFVSCAKGNKTALEGEGGSSSETNKFYAMAWGDAHLEDYRKQGADFVSKYPQYDFTFDMDTQYLAFLVTRSASDNLPDLFFLAPYVALTDYAKGGFLLDLSDQPWVSQFSPNVLNAVSYDGKVYAFPYSMCFTGYLYDIDLFNSLGLEIPTTVSEFRTLCETLKKSGRQPLALGGGGGNGWVYEQLFCSLFGTAAGDRFEELVSGLNAGTVSFRTWPNYEGVKAMFEMTAKEYNYAKPMDYDYTAMVSTFASGQSGMYHNGSWSPGDVLKLESNKHIGLFGYPISENPKDVRISWEAEISVAAAHNTKAVSGVKDFFKYLADPNGGAKTTAELQGRVPVVSVEVPASVVSRTYEDAQTYINANKVNPWLRWRYPGGFEDSIIGDMTDYAIGNITFDQLCDIADKKWQQLYNN